MSLRPCRAVLTASRAPFLLQATLALLPALLAAPRDVRSLPPSPSPRKGFLSTWPSPLGRQSATPGYASSAVPQSPGALATGGLPPFRSWSPPADATASDLAELVKRVEADVLERKEVLRKASEKLRRKEATRHSDKVRNARCGAT